MPQDVVDHRQAQIDRETERFRRYVWIVGRLTDPYLECEFAGNIFELNLASRRLYTVGRAIRLTP